MGIKILKWLRKPNAQRGKGEVRSREIQFTWNPCKPAPRAFRQGQRVVLFLVGDVASPHSCARSHLLESDPEYKNLKRRLTNGGRVD